MPAKPAFRNLFKQVLALLLVAATGIGAAHAGDDDNDIEPYSIGLWGDMPYSDVQAQTGVPNLITDMNSQKLKFSVFDGDWKAGNAIVGSVTPTTCSNELYAQSLGYLNTLKAPAMFTPGDNDWTDCDRPKNGGYNSLERLEYERALFFSTPYSLGMRKLKQDVQTGAPFCLGSDGNGGYRYVSCVENRRWMVGKVVYVTLNVQGSCNNLCDTSPDPAEYDARNAANISWLNQAFAYAKERNAVAVMIISQADPGFSKFEFDAPQRDPKTLAQTDGNPDGFKDFLLAVRDAVIAFRRPVAYVHGDSHYFRIDKPMVNTLGQRLENFTRIETFGDNAANGTNDMNWVKVAVDPRSREVFAYTPIIVPANRVAVPAP